jgi:hypothetical protein
VWPEGLGKLKKFVHLMSRTRNVPDCSTVPHPLRSIVFCNDNTGRLPEDADAMSRRN